MKTVTVLLVSPLVLVGFLGCASYFALLVGWGLAYKALQWAWDVE